MRKKVLCFVLALLMCVMVTVPAIAESDVEMPLNRADITASFGLKHVSGSKYRMWAKINNPEQVSVFVRLTLYDSSYAPLASIYKTSSNSLISLYKDLSLVSGTYHLRLSITADGATHTVEKTYNI